MVIFQSFLMTYLVRARSNKCVRTAFASIVPARCPHRACAIRTYALLLLLLGNSRCKQVTVMILAQEWWFWDNAGRTGVYSPFEEWEDRSDRILRANDKTSWFWSCYCAWSIIILKDSSAHNHKMSCSSGLLTQRSMFGLTDLCKGQIRLIVCTTLIFFPNHSVDDHWKQKWP